MFASCPCLSNLSKSNVGACWRLIVRRGDMFTARLKNNNTFYHLWENSLSSLTLISAALPQRWSDEESAWMNNAETPANKRHDPLTPFHNASTYAIAPRACKLSPSAPVKQQMTAESNINKPEAAHKSKRRKRPGWEEKVKRKNAASVSHPTTAALDW